MKQIYEYMHVTTAMDSIEIEDIGNCNITAFNDEGDVWLLSIKTKLGFSEIIETGPFDTGKTPNFNYFLYRRNSFEYKENKLDKIIEKFINSPNKFITQVLLIDNDEVITYLQNLKDKI